MRKTRHARGKGRLLPLLSLFLITSFPPNAAGATAPSTGAADVLQTGQRAQQPRDVMLRGRVTDAAGVPVAGVSVVVDGTTRGVVTDTQGAYAIAVPAEGATIVFSFLGMETRQVGVEPGRTVLDVVMEETSIGMDQVVVTGIFDRSEELYLGAANTITEEELRQFRGRNLISTISNIDPSVMLLQNNEWGSNPNRLPDVRIRGGSGMPGFGEVSEEANAAINTPLVVLDGFEATLEKLMDIDENEVASITILKDGSATSLYGSRGANGVIVITTKQPVAGKLRFTYRGTIDIEAPDLTEYNLLDARGKFELEERAGMFGDNIIAQGPGVMVGIQRYRSEILKLLSEGVDTYWLSQPLRTGVGQNHNVKAEGGDEAFRYSISLQYKNIAGVMKDSHRNTLNGGINIAYYHSKLIFRNNLMIGYNESQESPFGNFADYAKLNPYWRPYDDDGKPVKRFGPYNYSFISQLDTYNNPIDNPMYDATTGWYDRSDYIDITNNFSVEWNPLEELTVRGSLGVTSVVNSHSVFKPGDHSDFADYGIDDYMRKGSYDYTDGRDFSYTAMAMANYNKTWAERHMLVAGVSMELQQSRNRSYSFRSEGHVDDVLDSPSVGMQYPQNDDPNPNYRSPGGGEGITRRVGLVGDVNYSYDERYLATLSMRMDGASYSGANNRFAPFWSGAVGWNIHNEKFMEGSFVDYFRLRASYGVTGMPSLSMYDVQRMYKMVTNDNYNGWSGSQIMGLGNEDLTLQQVRKFDVGLSLHVFDRRLQIEADYYRHDSDNAMGMHEIPYSNGFRGYVENVGATRSEGFEVMATVWALRDNERNVYWSISANIAHYTDKILKLSQALKDELAELQRQFASSPNRIIREGDSLDALYVVRSLGIDPSTGRELYLTRDGEVTYNWNPADRVYAGITRPDYSGSVSTMFRWREVTLSASFGYRWGGVQYNNTLIDKVENADLIMNVDRRVLTDRWAEPGDVARFRGLDQRIAINYSSRFVQDESAFSCQNINLSYRFADRKWLSRAGISSLVLSASTDELFYLTTVKRERGTQYPFSRRYSFSASIIF